MKVKKFEDRLILELENEKNIQDVIDSEGLFWNDLYFVVDNGHLYLLDSNRDKVCFVDDNSFENLLRNKTITLEYHENNPDYEFNQDC